MDWSKGSISCVLEIKTKDQTAGNCPPMEFPGQKQVLLPLRSTVDPLCDTPHTTLEHVKPFVFSLIFLFISVPELLGASKFLCSPHGPRTRFYKFILDYLLSPSPLHIIFFETED